MLQVTNQASGAWVGMSLDYLRECKTGIVIETMFDHADANVHALREFRESEHQTELVVLAVPVYEALLLFAIFAKSGTWAEADRATPTTTNR